MICIFVAVLSEFYFQIEGCQVGRGPGASHAAHFERFISIHPEFSHCMASLIKMFAPGQWLKALELQESIQLVFFGKRCKQLQYWTPNMGYPLLKLNLVYSIQFDWWNYCDPEKGSYSNSITMR